MLHKFCFILSFLFASAIYPSRLPTVIQENSLLKYSHAVNSQYGEEGIIDAIMTKIGVSNGFLVEFGGYDGVTMSNTRLLAEKGWRGAFIEPSASLFAKMKNSFKQLPKILCIKEFITPFKGDSHGSTIDEIADQYFPHEEIDVMSIDIDGLDHVIFKNLKRKPKLIVIEGGMFWHPMMQLEVPDEIAAKNVQQPIIVMTKIAKQQGYELICSTFNAFFIRNDLYDYFSNIDNDPSRIWCEALLHIKNIKPNLYKKLLQIRKTDWIQEWESKDPNITFQIP